VQISGCHPHQEKVTQGAHNLKKFSERPALVPHIDSEYNTKSAEMMHPQKHFSIFYFGSSIDFEQIFMQF